MDLDSLQEYIAKLNQEQQQAATYGSGGVLVLAAAGSGKTSTLTCRIAYLIGHEKIPARNILAVTFTNKAAKEMVARLQKMGVDTKALWIGTFHGICNRILRYHAKEAGLLKNFHIMDSQDQLSFLKRVLRSNGYDPKVVNVNDLQDKINGYKEVGWRSNQLRIGTLERKYYELYEQACLKDNCVDFGELLLGCYELFQNNPHISEHYSETFRHILVDEFQDTSELQYKWLKILTSHHKNIFAVGDDDQAIYGFRGAKPENLNILKHDYNAQVIKIEKNYRSDAYILEAANAVIAHNTNRQGKNLVATKPARQMIGLYTAFNDEQESGFVASEIKRMRRAGIPYRQMAILYRTNGQSRSIEKALMSQNIPYIVYGGFRFFDRQEVKHAMAYLRLAHNANDNMAFLRVANTPARAIGDAALKKLEVAAQQQGCSLFEMAKNSDAKTVKKYEAFIQNIEKLQTYCKGKNLPDMVRNVIVYSGLEEMYEKDEKEGEERLDNLYELISAAEVFIAENKNADIDDFFAFATLETDVASKKRDPDADTVKMMTVHASKGLEFEIVFVTGMEETLFPHANSIGEPTAVEEERRLMYVAITRAKEMLYLSNCEERLLHGQRQRFIRSRFLKEIPQKLIQKLN
jgi:DNA helicase II / ATP-dependent DNA helicase PcrA